MKAAEIRSNYEANTGNVIVERFARLDPLQFPGVLVASHGPFAWGESVEDAVRHGVILEHLARLASETLHIQPKTGAMQRALLDKHFSRKHGRDAYYGQRKPSPSRMKSTKHNP
jgi:L-ribulose-5-phosphate 4-epimerase